MKKELLYYKGELFVVNHKIKHFREVNDQLRQKIDIRNKEIFQLTKDQVVDLLTPPATPKKRKRKLSDIMESYLASFEDSPKWGDDECKEEIEYKD